MSPRAWSKEQIETLRVLFVAGDDDVAIAAKMARMFSCEFSRNKVIGKRLRLGLYREGAFSPAPKTSKPAKTKGLVPPAKPNTPPPVTLPVPAPAPSLKGPIAPTPLPAKPLGAPHTVPLPLLRRRTHQCGWPINDGGPFLFCAQPKAPGERNYCHYHQRLALGREGRRRRKAAV